MAGLWSTWRPKGAPKDSPPLLSCTIITTDAAGPLAEIHDRMPLTISASDWDRWLDPDAPDRRGPAARARRPRPDRDSRGVAAGQQHPQQRARADRAGRAGTRAGHAAVGLTAAGPSPPHRARRTSRCRRRRRARAWRPRRPPPAGRAWRRRRCSSTETCIGDSCVTKYTASSIVPNCHVWLACSISTSSKSAASRSVIVSGVTPLVGRVARRRRRSEDRGDRAEERVVRVGHPRREPEDAARFEQAGDLGDLAGSARRR